MKTFRIDQYKCKPAMEKPLLEAVLKELAKYDLLIGQNLDAFDLPYLMSRAIRLGVAWTLKPFTYDTKKAFRRLRLRTRDNGYGQPTAALDMIADFLDINQMKTKIYPAAWWKSVWEQNRETMNEIVSHCEADVKMTAEIYQELLPMDNKAVIRRLL